MLFAFIKIQDMKITINTEVLKKEHLSMKEFLVMLIGYYDVNYKKTLDKLIGDDTLNKHVFNPCGMILSNNTKNQVAKILLESDERANSLGIDYDHAKRRNSRSLQVKM